MIRIQGGYPSTQRELKESEEGIIDETKSKEILEKDLASIIENEAPKNVKEAIMHALTLYRMNNDGKSPSVSEANSWIEKANLGRELKDSCFAEIGNLRR